MVDRRKIVSYHFLFSIIKTKPIIIYNNMCSYVDFESVSYRNKSSKRLEDKFYYY
jgi:hypothetical protein